MTGTGRRRREALRVWVDTSGRRLRGMGLRNRCGMTWDFR